jgi:HD-like signal output (HDOD) protein
MLSIVAKAEIQGFDIREFWKHAIGVAMIGSVLDRQTGGHCQEDVFTAGIIHDIGKIVMVCHFRDLFQTTWDTMRREGITFREAEQHHFPVNHAVIGEHLSRRWHLPPLMQRVIGQHHTDSSSDAVNRLIYIVHAADALHHGVLCINRPKVSYLIQWSDFNRKFSSLAII